MNMREKIARGLARSHDYREYDEVGGAPAWKLFENDADAVLDALVEPTTGMQEMGDHAYNLTGMSGASGFPANSDEHTTFIWQAMIQAAKEGK